MSAEHSSPTPPTTPSRHQRRREQTRSRLVESARMLFAQRGVESVGLHEVTNQADLGAGTIYNYFPSKESLVEAVLSDSIESFGQRLDRIQEIEDNPAAVFAFSLRHLVGKAAEDELWGWMIVRLGVAHPQLLDILGPRARRDLQIGADAGLFDIEDLGIATACVFGALVATLHLSLTKTSDRDLGVEFACTMLKMAGMESHDAIAIAGRALPPLPENS